ncbi:MAG: hypothetical protein OEY13_09115, partial [Gammaproteobacteria bacterium]|nr:hypothetical protein [Gammaproteobacteria bacterium]
VTTVRSPAELGAAIFKRLKGRVTKARPVVVKKKAKVKARVKAKVKVKVKAKTLSQARSRSATRKLRR